MTRHQLHMLLVPIWLGVSYLSTGWQSNGAAFMALYAGILAGVFLWRDGR